ncbi:MAG: DUF4142 domain-containing protein [Amaricoccus sp.]
MKRLLAGTALMLVAAAPAMAQQAAGGDRGLFIPADPKGIYASDLIGMDVYSSATDYAAEYGNDQRPTADTRASWDDIGEINDIVLSPDGSAEGVLVDVGGFLGLGAHTVALDMSQIHFLSDEGNNRFAAVTSSKEALEAAPEYKRPEERTAAATTNDTAGSMMAAPGTNDSGGAGMMAAAPGTPIEPQAFADTAASSNMFEIRSSQLALERTENADVRAFAQKMVDDHTAAGEKMKAAAKSDGVTPADGMAQQDQAKYDQLAADQGSDFDHAYLAAQVAAHDDAVALFQAFARQDDGTALTGFAAETLPTLQQHQSAVHALDGSM